MKTTPENSTGHDVWTLAEQSGGRLRGVSFELLSRGRALADQLGGKLCSVLLGHGVSDEALEELIQRGADRVMYVDDPRLAVFQNETYANMVSHLIRRRQPHVVLAAATTLGRVVMPYVAIQVNTGLTADCTGLAIDPETNGLLQTRPAIGGNIMATIKTPNHTPQMATVRPRSTRPLERQRDRVGAIERLPLPDELVDARVECLDFHADTDTFVNLEEADIVVAAGRGVKRADNLPLVDELADRLAGVVGASRQVIDRGWLSYPHQIGLSGKTISAKLLVTAGISGSIQFLAGVKTCEHIVAVNSDPEATIFDVADFGIVGDLFEVLPNLSRKLAAAKAKRESE